ncbi:MAG: response regulator [Hyphomicrobium sp.]
MQPSTSAPAPNADLLSIASDIDLASVANPPEGLHVENLRRRGIDVVRVKWGGGAKSKGWLRFLSRGSRAKAADMTATLTFVDQQIRYQNTALRGSEARETQIAMSDLASVEVLTGGAGQPPRLKLGFKDASLTIGDGLPVAELNWLRDRLVLEAAGLTWKPLFNVGKRTTRATSQPDEQPYQLMRSSRGRLIELYLGQAVSKCDELKAAMKASDKAAARAAAHWLKSSSAAVGAIQLSELCQRLEIDFDAKDMTRATALAPHVFAEFDKVRAAFQSDEATHDSLASPIVEAETSNAEPAIDGRLSGVTALLVDDSRVNQEIAADCLMRAGVSVAFANNGPEAIDQNSAASFDVILMDCQMSGVDGFATTQFIRDFERRVGRSVTPIIALTANALRDDRNICLAAGMNDYLSKPFLESDLIDVVARWTRERPDDHVIASEDEIQAFKDALEESEPELPKENAAA